VITAPTEKTEYTTTKPTENARKLSSQIFDFQTFVTEIFRFKVSHFSFFQKFQKTQILTILAAKLRALPEHLNQSQQVENDPRSVYFKVDFINFFRRSLRFGAILSDCFDHILISEKIDIFDENCENGQFCFSHISMKTESPIKVWGSKTHLSDRPRRLVGKKAKTILSKGPILLYKITLFWPFFRFFGAVFAIFWLFLDHFWVDTRYVGWTSGCYQLMGSNCSLSLVFHFHFWQFFCHFSQIFGVLSLFHCIFCHFVCIFR